MKLFQLIYKNWRRKDVIKITKKNLEFLKEFLFALLIIFLCLLALSITNNFIFDMKINYQDSECVIINNDCYMRIDDNTLLNKKAYDNRLIKHKFNNPPKKRIDNP